MAAPKQQTMARHEEMPARVTSGTPRYCDGCCGRSRRVTPLEREERVFYDSARTQRGLLGKIHYCISCPGWSKVTTERVVYSRWHLITAAQLPKECFQQCCCVQSSADWSAPDPTSFATPVASKDGGCCAWRIPCGRQLDTFDSDIVVDASAHQTLCQICRGEGDIVLYRKAGADLSDPSEVFVVADVVKPFDVFNEITFELSKINLKGAAAAALGQRMGATVWSFDARSSSLGPAVATNKGWRGDVETIFYDSRKAPRTCIGSCFHSDIFCPHEYKITSERVTYTQYDMWYLLDEPFGSGLCCIPYYCTRGCARECCCAVGASSVAEERMKRATQLERAKEAVRVRNRGCLGSCCAVPVGRTAHYFDIDLVADVRAQQMCWQLILNEGTLEFGRLYGADASHDSKLNSFFRVRDVPEVFAHFDEFSYELSKLDLKNFRQSAMAGDMLRESGLG